jgi:hypothetical protein
VLRVDGMRQMEYEWVYIWDGNGVVKVGIGQ